MNRKIAIFLVTVIAITLLVSTAFWAVNRSTYEINVPPMTKSTVDNIPHIIFADDQYATLEPVPKISRLSEPGISTKITHVDQDQNIIYYLQNEGIDPKYYPKIDSTLTEPIYNQFWSLNLSTNKRTKLFTANVFPVSLLSPTYADIAGKEIVGIYSVSISPDNRFVFLAMASATYQRESLIINLENGKTVIGSAALGANSEVIIWGHESSYLVSYSIDEGATEQQLWKLDKDNLSQVANVEQLSTSLSKIAGVYFEIKGIYQSDLLVQDWDDDSKYKIVSVAIPELKTAKQVISLSYNPETLTYPIVNEFGSNTVLARIAGTVFVDPISFQLNGKSSVIRFNLTNATAEFIDSDALIDSPNNCGKTDSGIYCLQDGKLSKV